MADTPTTTETTSGDTSHPSEFSQPVGVKDGDVFDKFFGEESDLWDKNGKLKEPKSKGEKPAGKASSKESDDKPKKPESASKPEKKPEAKAEAKDEKKPEKSERKESADSSKASNEKSDASAKKSAESQTGTEDTPDPKKLYKEAKSAEDRRTQRRLYKKAMEAAFGEVPEEFDDRKWAAAREKREKDTADLAAKDKKITEKLNTSVQRLAPAIGVMKRLMAAGFVHVDQKTGTVTNSLDAGALEQSVEVLKALREIQNGDFTVLGTLIEKAAGVDRDEAMKRYVKGVKVSPEGRASRQAALQAQQQAQAANDRIAALERQLREREQGLTEQQKQAQAQERTRAAHNEWLGRIREDLGDHPVLKLEKGAERVLRLIKKTAHPTLRSQTMTFEDAADRIIESERKRLKAARDLLEPEGTPPTNQRRRVPANPRDESADAGNLPDTPEASFDRIWNAKMAVGGRR